MCDNYVEDPTVSHDTNVILKKLHCLENLRQLGHHVVKHPTLGWNVSPGMDWMKHNQESSSKNGNRDADQNE